MNRATTARAGCSPVPVPIFSQPLTSASRADPVLGQIETRYRGRPCRRPRVPRHRVLVLTCPPEGAAGSLQRLAALLHSTWGERGRAPGPRERRRAAPTQAWLRDHRGPHRGRRGRSAGRPPGRGPPPAGPRRQQMVTGVQKERAAEKYPGPGAGGCISRQGTLQCRSLAMRGRWAVVPNGESVRQTRARFDLRQMLIL